MRSINTSLISTLPVLALMVVAVWLLGVGTLKDLALVQLVGIIVGTYSSIFFATPLLVTLRERTELVRTHTRRVIRRRGPETGKAPDKGQERGRARAESDDDEGSTERASASFAATGEAAPSKPAPGARPVRQSAGRHARPTGKQNKR
jgi:preprotein translocase subunit SecF